MLTQSRHGSLINNAAISLESTNPTRIHETHPGQYDETMRVNARSVFLGCRCVIARMLGQDVRDEGGRGTRGAIVNIASIYGVVADRVVCGFLFFVVFVGCGREGVVLTRRRGDSVVCGVQGGGCPVDQADRAGLCGGWDSCQCCGAWLWVLFLFFFFFLLEPGG